MAIKGPQITYSNQKFPSGDQEFAHNRITFTLDRPPEIPLSKNERFYLYVEVAVDNAEWNNAQKTHSYIDYIDPGVSAFTGTFDSWNWNLPAPLKGESVRLRAYILYETLGRSEYSNILTIPLYTPVRFTNIRIPSTVHYNKKFPVTWDTIDPDHVLMDGSDSIRGWWCETNAYNPLFYAAKNETNQQGIISSKNIKTAFCTLTPGFRDIYGTDYEASKGERSNVATVITPLAPPNTLTIPEKVDSGQKIVVSWSAVVGATRYQLQRNYGTGWKDVYFGADLQFQERVGIWEQLQYRIRTENEAGSGDWNTSNPIAVNRISTLKIPSITMQNQPIILNWTELTGAESYTVQRKANTDSEWVQVYSGPLLTCTETVGAWTSVQYRVQAVFGGTPGGWATSEAIPVVSASALVISGQDGDLGTLVNDVPYSVSSDTGNQIQLTLLVNGAEVYTRMIDSGYANKVLILDLAAGTGTITLKATVQASGGPVSAVRSWTYTKAAIPFETGRVDLTRLMNAEKVPQYPATVAEAVRLPGGKTLDQVTQYPAQVVTGSYVGTGTYGANSPNTLHFVFEPKLALITSEGAVDLGDTTGMAWNGNSTIGAKKITVNGNDLSWYGNSAANQLNTAGTRYYYTVVG